MLKAYGVIKDAWGAIKYNGGDVYHVADTIVITKTSQLVKIVDNKSAVMVGSAATSKGSNGVCVCKEYDLIWGSKVSCEFRMKVVDICKDLWPTNYKVMANNLMAVFNWETGGTFKSDVPNQAGSGATGLIQFMPDKAKLYFGKCTMETVPNYFNSKSSKLHNLPRVKEFAEMVALKQLDYVKKYFEPLRNKKLDFIDFYLQVLFPVSSGRPEHVVFADSLTKLDLINESDKLKSLRVEKYPRNSGMDLDKNGKVMKSEITKSVEKFKTEGISYRNIDKCENIKQNTANTKCGKDCICTIKTVVDINGFINHLKIIKEHIRIIENGSFEDEKISIQKVILHRTAGPTTESCKTAFKNGRKNKKGGFDHYGTHFIVGKDGVITQTASLSKITWHCKGWNSKSIGIEVVGCAIDINNKCSLNDKEIVGWEKLTEIQAKSVACLVKTLLKYYELDKTKIDCHEHLAAKHVGEGQVVYDAIKQYL